MKKIKFCVGALLLAGASLTFSSCIGSFALSNRVLSWNKNIGSKFVNELVFIAFCILPVYEVTMLADVVVLNSIEFWSGRNALTASTRTVETEQGRYLIACDGKGYTITHEETGISSRLDFEEESRTWSVLTEDGTMYPLMTYVDDTHVRMATPDGRGSLVELSEAGLMAYRADANRMLMAGR
ncbi:MAG: DUF3332 domain-containing protein [Muribaculaceae bacterium]|nr:DUF3332 domain-containing protein [Muribaculaceae bacterium]